MVSILWQAANHTSSLLFHFRTSFLEIPYEKRVELTAVSWQGCNKSRSSLVSRLLPFWWISSLAPYSGPIWMCKEVSRLEDLDTSQWHTDMRRDSLGEVEYLAAGICSHSKSSSVNIIAWLTPTVRTKSKEMGESSETCSPLIYSQLEDQLVSTRVLTSLT